MKRPSTLRSANSYTKALALLKVPSDEREEFIEKHDVEGLSVRELQKVIRERESAEAERDAAKHQAAELKGQLANAEAELASLRDEAKAKVAAASEAADREQALRDQLAEVRAELEAAKDAPIPEDQVKRIAAEEKKAAAEKHKAKMEKLIKETEVLTYLLILKKQKQVIFAQIVINLFKLLEELKLVIFSNIMRDGGYPKCWLKNLEKVNVLEK